MADTKRGPTIRPGSDYPLPPRQKDTWTAFPRGRGDSEDVPKKPGRNKPCPCGSEKKFKRCCGKTLQQRFAAYEHMDEYPELTPGYFANDATPVEEE